MNSSGIKRGLAATAVGALAVTGLPFLASSASAAPGDTLSVAYVGPARNGGAEGAVVILKAPEGQIADGTLIELAGLTNAEIDSQNNDTQAAEIVGTPTVVDDAAGNEFGGDDGFDEIHMRIKTTAAPGTEVKFRAFNNDNAAAPDTDLDAGEARTEVSITTAGAPTSVSVSPASQTVPEDVESGDYTVTFKDAAGRTTQLTGSETVTVDPDSDTDLNSTAAPAIGVNLVLDKTTSPRGVATFTAESSEPVEHMISITGTTGIAGTTAVLDVVEAASGLTADDVDFVTGADSWDGFGGGTFGTGAGEGVVVRVDQTSVRVDINKPAAAGQTVQLNLQGTGVTFGNRDGSGTVSTVLDANGVGSIVITPDAGTIQEGDSFTVAGAGIPATKVSFARAALAAVVSSAPVYIAKPGDTVAVTVTAVDQFGNPIPGAQITAQRTAGPNKDTAPTARQVADANGQVTFNLADTKATIGTSDTVKFTAYKDQFDATGVSSTATINYTATGQGADYSVLVDSKVPSGSSYDPTSVFAYVSTDGVINDGAGDSSNDSIDLSIDDASVGTPYTITADNGALLVPSTGATSVAAGKASVSGVVPASGDLDFRVIGTKPGLVTLNITAGGRTETAQVSFKTLVGTANYLNTARNVAISGPDEATSGDVVTFDAVVTDAFGNPVVGFDVSNLNIQVTGPARFQDSDARTDATGTAKINVKLDDDADSSVTVRVAGTSGQFGAAANQFTAASAANSAPGLTASVASASATISDVVDLAGLEQAVEEAQDAVDDAEDALAAARGELKVAKAERSVAKKQVKAAKKALKKAKRQHKGVQAAKRELRNERGDFRIAKAKVQAEQAQAKRKLADLKEAQAELEAAEQALEDAQSDEG